jgi:GTP pyrophosphokinase
VGRILYGLTRVKSLYLKSHGTESENFSGLLLSLAEDVRVILIMIFDRLVLMRFLDGPDESEYRTEVAEETAWLYAPLAHKLGLYQIKSELEDLSLKFLEPEAYYHIKDKLNATKRAREEYMQRFMSPIEQMLNDSGFSYHMKGRTKSIHSIWQKMKKQHCDFEGVYDLFAIRIILDAPRDKEKSECWQVYSLITDKYKPNPKRLRDWLSIPKSNGYESLHITVMGPEGKWVEVQIRTERMDDVAEHGLAAHWRYKGVKSGDSGIESWLSDMREALEATDKRKVMDQIHTSLKTDEVYVFSPKGDLYKLPQGSTVLDFAYAIHTNVGNHCIGAKISGKNASIRQLLQSGDQVSILTSPSQTPKRAWAEFVATGRARAKIRQSIKELELKEGALAREQLERTFRNRKLQLDQNILHQTIGRLGYKEITLFYKDLADGRLSMETVLEAYILRRQIDEGLVEKNEVHSADEFLQSVTDTSGSKDDVLVIDRNLKGLDYSLAKCCNPVYGDDIFGFVTRMGGIKIHRKACPNAVRLRERFGYRIVKARWAGEESGNKGMYPVLLRIVGNDSLGVVNNISSIISKEERINMRSFNIEVNDGLFTGSLTLMITDTTALERLVKKIKAVKGVKNVMR